MEKEISLIVAVAKNGVIGNKGKIPWNLPEDQQRFKQLTMGGVVIMGRRTFEEIFEKLGKPLPGRHTIVVSGTKNYADLGCETASSLAAALEIAATKFPDKPVFICGGAQLYKEALEMQPPVLKKLYITEVDLEPEGDAFFPEYNRENFEVISYSNNSLRHSDASIRHSEPAEESSLSTTPFPSNTGFLDRLGMTVGSARNDGIQTCTQGTVPTVLTDCPSSLVQTDTLLNGYKILQDKDRFMYGIDAVLLSAFAAPSIRKKNKVVDLGTGTAIIPLLLKSASYAEQITGVEVQAESAAMAKKSVALNGLENSIAILEGDIKSIPDGKLLGKHSVEVVVSNPPYMISDHCKECANDAKSIARHEVLCSLEDVVAAADYLLKPHGVFVMVHRPYRLAEIFAAFGRHGLEPKRMQLVYPFADKEPNIVLIEGRKNAQPRLEIEAPLVVRESNGEYTEQLNKIYDMFKNPIQ